MEFKCIVTGDHVHFYIGLQGQQHKYAVRIVDLARLNEDSDAQVFYQTCYVPGMEEGERMLTASRAEQLSSVSSSKKWKQSFKLRDSIQVVNTFLNKGTNIGQVLQALKNEGVTATSRMVARDVKRGPDSYRVFAFRTLCEAANVHDNSVTTQGGNTVSNGVEDEGDLMFNMMGNIRNGNSNGNSNSGNSGGNSNSSNSGGNSNSGDNTPPRNRVDQLVRDLAPNFNHRHMGKENANANQRKGTPFPKSMLSQW